MFCQQNSLAYPGRALFKAGAATSTQKEVNIFKNISGNNRRTFFFTLREPVEKRIRQALSPNFKQLQSKIGLALNFAVLASEPN